MHKTIVGAALAALLAGAATVRTQTTTPTELVGKTLTEVSLRSRYGITVVCIKPAGGAFTYATADTRLGAGDTLMVAGETRLAEAFADLP